MDQQTLDQWGQQREPAILKVSEVSAIISRLLDDERLSGIWVTGEITNFKKHQTGHLYFSLSELVKGEAVVIQCSIWKRYAHHIPFSPADGMLVQAYGAISHYEAGGRYSFQVTQIRDAGSGDKAILIEQWKREMAAKGWFATERKRPLPIYPVKIGVVTSRTGPVIHDIRNVASWRFPVEIILSPTAVQGTNAHEEIAAAIKRVCSQVDVLIVGRGGGSSEDLFSFNHPRVVEAIVHSPVPVVTAIGHEVDITLADLAADFRASTPSHAAEACVPDRRAELESLRHMQARISRRIFSGLEQATLALNEYRDRLSAVRMLRKISDKQEQLVDLADRLTVTANRVVRQEDLILSGLTSRLHAQSPTALLKREIPERRAYLSDTQERLSRATARHLNKRREELCTFAALLKAHGPDGLAVRGYSVVTRDGQVISSITTLQPGDQISIRFSDGNADAMISEVKQREKV